MRQVMRLFGGAAHTPLHLDGSETAMLSVTIITFGLAKSEALQYA